MSRLHTIKKQKRSQKLQVAASVALFAVVTGFSVYNYFYQEEKVDFISPVGSLSAKPVYAYDENVTSAILNAKPKVVEVKTIVEQVQSKVEEDQEEIKSYIREVFSSNPDEALEVARCESGYKSVCNDGTNRDGSVDCGIFQVNLNAHKKERADMLDYKQNIDYAKELYDRKKWYDWYSSDRCHGLAFKK